MPPFRKHQSARSRFTLAHPGNRSAADNARICRTQLFLLPVVRKFVFEVGADIVYRLALDVVVRSHAAQIHLGLALPTEPKELRLTRRAFLFSYHEERGKDVMEVHLLFPGEVAATIIENVLYVPKHAVKVFGNHVTPP